MSEKKKLSISTIKEAAAKGVAAIDVDGAKEFAKKAGVRISEKAGEIKESAADLKEGHRGKAV